MGCWMTAPVARDAAARNRVERNIMKGTVEIYHGFVIELMFCSFEEG